MLASNKFQTLFVITLIVYIVLLILIGYISGRRKSKGKDFVSGGKSLSILPLIGTIGATMIGVGLSIGATANGYLHGWGGSVFALGSSIGLVTLLIFTPMRRYGFDTMAEEAQFYYGGKKCVRYVASVMMLLSEIIWTGSAINGSAQYLCYIMGWTPLLAKTVITLAFFSFAIFGGYLSVVWTDTVQFVIIIGGFLLIVTQAVPIAGGWDAIRTAYEASGNSGALSFYGLGSYGIMAACALLVSAFFGAVSTQSFRLRIYTAKDEKVARKSFLVSAGLIFCFSLFPSVIGMSAFAISWQNHTPLAQADYAFAYIATEVLPPALGLLFLVAGLSSAISSADTNALSGVTVITNDLYPAIKGKALPEKHYRLASRIALFFVVLVAYLAALYATDVIGFVVNVVGSILPGVGVCMLAGRLWRRATWQGGLASIFGGTIFGVVYLLVPPINAWCYGTFCGAAIPATILSLVLCVGVSLCTPANTLTEEERLQLVLDARCQNAPNQDA